MTIYGPQALLADVHHRGLCIACGGCVDLCPYFRTYRGKTAMLFPCDLTPGRCHAHCPKTEVDLDELARHRGEARYPAAPLGTYRRILAARSGERWRASGYQSGGTVSALTAFALDAGEIESAVLTDRQGLEPVPLLATGPDEVARCATSKYTAAPTLAALNRAVLAGHRRIGVVGTPCQMTAVAQMRTNPLQREDFTDPVGLVIGLFCTWALDTRRLIDRLSEVVDVATIRKMDIPPPPAEVLAVDTTQGRLEFPLAQIRSLVPAGCSVCPDMTAEWADVSVGVLEDAPDWNTLIVRSEKGDALVERAVAMGWLVTDAYPRRQLEHLALAAHGKKRRALVKAGAEGLLNTGPGGGPSVFRLDANTLDAIIGGQEA